MSTDLEEDATSSAVVLYHHLFLVVLCIDVCDLFVDVCQLHVILIEFIVVDDLVDFLHPFIIHKHLIIALSYGLLLVHELLILWF